MTNRKMDRRTAAKVKATAVACDCGHVFVTEFDRFIEQGKVMCAICAMTLAYATAAKNKDYALFN